MKFNLIVKISLLMSLSVISCKTAQITDHPDSKSVGGSINSPQGLNITGGFSGGPPIGSPPNSSYDITMVGGLITYEKNLNKTSLCSGAWICPNVMITANQCLSIPTGTNYTYFVTSASPLAQSAKTSQNGLGTSYFTATPYTSQVMTNTVITPNQDFAILTTDNFKPAATSFARFSNMTSNDIGKIITSNNTPVNPETIIVGFGPDSTPAGGGPANDNLNSLSREWGYTGLWRIIPNNTYQLVENGPEIYNGPVIQTYPYIDKTGTITQYSGLGDIGGPVFWPTPRNLEMIGVISGRDKGYLPGSNNVPIYQVAPAILDAKKNICRGPMTPSSALTCTAYVSGTSVNFTFSDTTYAAGTTRRYQALVANNQVISLGTGTEFDYTSQGSYSGSTPIPPGQASTSALWLTIVMNISDINDQKVWTQCQVQPGNIINTQQ